MEFNCNLSFNLRISKWTGVEGSNPFVPPYCFAFNGADNVMMKKLSVHHVLLYKKIGIAEKALFHPCCYLDHDLKKLLLSLSVTLANRFSYFINLFVIITFKIDID